MEMQTDKTNVNCLMMGQPPEDTDLRRSMTVGLESLTDFLRQHYLSAYIPDGGSKIKFITGRPGSGKTHFARYMADEADALNYVTVSFSAEDIWLHDFRDVYLEILRQCDIERILGKCAEQIIRDMGGDPTEIPAGKTYLDFLVEKGEADAITKSGIRSTLRSFFTKNPLLDNAFASCCSLLTGGMLGHPVLEPATKELLLAYLAGDKTIKFSQLRPLGFSPARITRYNARHLLRSLTEVIHLAGYAGLLVVIDDLDILVNRSSESSVHYTKLRREDVYESIRQLIDDIDNMHYVLFMLSFNRELIDDESYGMKSYQALWLRIQNEVVSTRFNRFADIIDLDRYADEAYSPAILCKMSKRLVAVLDHSSAVPISEETALKLSERAQYGGIGLPYLVNRETIKGGGTDNA